MRKFMIFTIYEAHGVWFAEDNYGNSIWARSRDELLRLSGGTPC